jgi:hypothetical protein
VTELTPWQRTGGSLPPKIGATVAALGAAATLVDGQEGLLRVTADHTEELRWNTAAARWEGLTEYVLVDQADTWGMDLANHSLANIRANWCRFYNSLPYGKQRAYLTVAAAAADATLTVNDTTGFTASGTLRIRGENVSYTGKTATTFTGVTGLTVAAPINVTLVTQGEVGGYGTAVEPLDRVGELYAAGLVLEARASAFLNGSQDNIAMDVAAYCWDANHGASFNLPATVTPTGGLGFGPTLTGPTAPGAPNRSTERAFQQIIGAWTQLAFTPTQRYLFAALYGRMTNVAANDNGEEYGYQLRLRWRTP